MGALGLNGRTCLKLGKILGATGSSVAESVGSSAPFGRPSAIEAGKTAESSGLYCMKGSCLAFGPFQL